jgi:signal transduction histidine kinase/NO-binding membrane sensor protein with MHYT domain/ActR/RegA family two-component response regulator
LDDLLYCLSVEHDWRYVVGAVVLCVAGLATTVGLLSLARSSGRGRGIMFGAGATAISALTVWATHFLAMVGYRGVAEVRYDGLITLSSLVIVCVGFAVGIALLMSRPGKAGRVVAGLTAAASTTAMHFVGLSAVTIQGARIEWQIGPTVLAVIAGMAMASLIGFIRVVPRQLRAGAATLLGSLTVATLHFGTMAAMVVTPAPVTVVGDLSQSTLQITLLAAVIVTVIFAAFMTGIAYWSRTNSLAQLREAIEGMPDGLAFFDDEDRLVAWNQRYAEVNPELKPHLRPGITFGQLVEAGLTTDTYVEAFGRRDEWLAERMAARLVGFSTMEQRMAGDIWLRVQDRRTADGGTVTVVNDITDLKRDAIALAEARDAAEAATQAKSAFLANMSHEIRTPLNGVIGLAQALARTDLTPEQSEMLELIQSSGQTLQTLLSDILDLARVESGRVEIAAQPFLLSRAVREAAQLYAASAADKGLQFFCDIEPDADTWVLGDAVRVKQILTNLVSNAVKFTGQGFVSLTAATALSPDGEPFLRFTVEDTGVGFDAEARDRLFNRFEQADASITRRYGGTGLGLAICRQLAEMMGGALDCESEPGGGSAFILTLPLIQASQPTAAAGLDASIEPEREGGGVRVLLADDHPTNRRVVELILAQAHVDLTSVEDGAQAFAAFCAQPFDLVLMDMQMPVMDGLTATREIRAHEAAMGTARTPIVMLTANALAEHVAAGQAAGADAHLSKPFSAEDLLTLVAECAAADPRAMAA